MCYLLILLYLLAPTFFFRSWLNVMFSYSNYFNKFILIDLTIRENLLFFGIPILLYCLGISWQSFIF
jgi:hypothetical protein